MSPEVRRAALLATARVALCSAVVGCAPKAPLAEPAIAEPAGAEPAASERAGPARPKTTKTEAECDAYVGEALAKGPADAGDAELVACCSAIADARDGRMGEAEPWVHRQECCRLLDWQGSMTCTPWGPPVPPEMA